VWNPQYLWFLFRYIFRIVSELWILNFEMSYLLIFVKLKFMIKIWNYKMKERKMTCKMLIYVPDPSNEHSQLKIIRLYIWFKTITPGDLILPVKIMTLYWCNRWHCQYQSVYYYFCMTTPPVPLFCHVIKTLHPNPYQIIIIVTS
jgi:hypothetical protein